jgi:MarR family transcriptional repressor of emrRAB
MNNAKEFVEVETSLERLRSRILDLPKSEILLSRVFLDLGRSMTSMLEQHTRPFGLSETELRVLTSLFSQPNGVAHPSELCARTSLSAANVSRISDVLVGRALITRGAPIANDRRKRILRITGQGEEMVHRILPTLFSRVRQMFGNLSVDDGEKLIRLLKRLSQKMDQAI